LLGVSRPAPEEANRFHVEALALRRVPVRYVRIMSPASRGEASVAELRLYEADPALPLGELRQAVAVERREGSTADLPSREPVLHRPGRQSPCMRGRTEPLLLRPDSPYF
jgi:hypothetical protein